MFTQLRNILSLCLLIICVVDLSAQAIHTGQTIEPALVFTTKSGLPQIQTTAMMQDSRGYIWAGTKRGLANYNGSKWTIEAKDIHVAMLSEISNGNLIAIVNRGGLASYLIYDGVKMNSSAPKLFDPNKFNCRINKDTLYHLNILDGKMYQYDLRKEKLIGEKVIDISKYSISGYSQKYGLILKQRIDGNLTNLLRLEDFSVIKQTKTRNTYPIPEKVNTEYFTNYEDGYTEYYDLNDFKLIGKIKYEDGEIGDIQFSTDENFFFSDQEKNYKYDRETNKVEVYKQINSTRNIFLEDEDGNLWNSSESGIQLFPKINFVDYTQRELSDAWFFYPYRGAYIYGNYSGGLKRVQVDPYRVERLASEKINRIYFNPSMMKGNLYIPGSTHISVMEGEKLRNIDIRKFSTPLLSSFYDEQTKSIYFGGLKSLLMLNHQESLTFYQDTKEIFARYVLAIDRFDDQHLIFGTSTDLCLFNTVTQNFSSLSDMFPTEKDPGAITIEKDDRGNFWIGNKRGLWFYNVDNETIVGISNSIIEENVMSVLQVKENLLAIGTSKNLKYLDLDEFYESGELLIKAFNFMNGFHGEEVAQNGMIMQDSILWVPSATNLISTNVNKVKFSPSFSNVIIRSINENVLNFTHENDEIFDMTYGTKDLEIEYEAIGINQPSTNTFQYKLIGYEDEWTPWTSDTKANYRDLASGEYEFVVRTRANSDLGTVLPKKKMKLRLEMPFYDEPDFISNAFSLALFMLMIIGALIYTIYQRRLAKVELDKRFKLLQVQTLQLQLNPHFLFNVLGTIQSLILEKDIDNANKYLVSFSKMIRRYLDYNVSAYKSLEANSTDTIKISLHEELDILKIYLEFEKLQLGDKFDYEINIEDDLDASEIQIPPLIIQPLIENCIKHGVVPKKGKSFIQLNVSLKGSGILIYIKDDGIGISRSLELQKSSMKQFKSLSLRLINERIDVLNSMGESISLEINDLPNEGGVEQVIFIDQIQNEA